MKNSKRILSLILMSSLMAGLFSSTAMTASAASTAQVYDLRVEDLIEPVGVDEANPTFSWKMKSDAVGAAQTAYCIVVTAPDGEEMWNTGWVEDDASVGIRYAGAELQPSTEYTVQVTVKDENGRETETATTTFETGLMSADAFDDASWISFRDYHLSDTTSYTIDFDFAINNRMQGFCFSMADSGTFFYWQVNAYEKDYIALRPHIKKNGSWAVTPTNATTANIESCIGYTKSTLTSDVYLHERIVVEGNVIKTYFGQTADSLTLAHTYTYTENVPLYSVGWRYGSTECAYFDNLVVKDGTGEVLYANDFSKSVTVSGNEEYAIEDGTLRTGATSTSSERISMILRESGSDNWSYYLSETTAYTIDFDFSISNRTQGFCFGMKDTDNLFYWQINARETRNTTGNVMLRPHIMVDGGWTVTPNSTNMGTVTNADTFPYNYEAVVGMTLHERIEVDGAVIKTYIGTDADSMTLVHTCTHTADVPLYNIGWRYGSTECSYFDNFVVKDSNGKTLYTNDFSDTGDFSVAGTTYYTLADGKLLTGKTAGSAAHIGMIRKNAVSDNLPAFRKSITPAGEVKSAKLYVSGLGVYEAYVNGERVGRLTGDGSVSYDELKPGFTEMADRKFYNSYDVTWMLQDGENVLSAVGSGGWWSDEVANYYGIENGFLAKLILTYTDGTQETVVTDSSWKTAQAAKLQRGTDIFSGERYDARVDESWMLPGFDDSDWQTVKISNEFTGEMTAWSGVPVTVRQDLERAAEAITVYEGATGATTGEYGKINVVATYTDGDEITLKPGQTLLVDFGQNFAGWEAFELKGASAGTTIMVEHGETVNDGNGATSRGNDGPEGSLYNANYRTATANTVYVASGDAEGESYHPSQTYYGFRYIEITTDATVTFTKITGQVVTSSQEDTGTLVTSDEDVNQLVSNIRWGMYSNYLSVPTDCPQRNERQGYSGDAQNFVEAGCFMGYSKSFLMKFMQDMRDCQRADGAFTGTAPTGKYAGSAIGTTGWADGGVIIPYYLYVMYGDKDVITENWEAMRLFMDSYMAGTDGMGGTTTFGDWLSFELNDTEIRQMLGVSYYAWDAMLMSYMAEAIGETEAAAHYQEVYEAEKALYQELYVQEDGTLIRTEQTVNLYALYLDLLPDDASVAAVTEVLINNIETNGNKLQTGFLGTEIIMHTLTKIGRTDMAYKLLLQHDNPSWLYSVDQGATTIWERWNSYTLESGFGAAGMNSLNHYSYGSVASWMFRGMAGISYDLNDPGFKHIVLTPQPDLSLPKVEASYESVYGTIVSKMNYTSDAWVYEAEIPANTTATIHVPVAEVASLAVNGVAVADITAADGLTYSGYADGVATFEAVAGSYTFVCDADILQMEGATIRATDTLTEQGIRFRVSFAEIPDNVVELGVMMLPKALLGDATLEVGQTYNGATPAYASVTATDELWDEYLAEGVVYARLNNSATGERGNVEIAARAYIKLDDGSYLYSSNEAEATGVNGGMAVKSVVSVAKAIAAANGGDEVADIKALIDQTAALSEEQVQTLLSWCCDHFDWSSVL